MGDEVEQSDELLVLKSIYGDNNFVCNDDEKPYTGHFDIDLKNDNVTVMCNGNAIPLNYLSPITLHFSLPDNYPSINPPKVNLACLWLTPQQLQMLGNKLDELWKESFNTVILYTWVNFLQTEICEYLDVKFPLSLHEDKLLKLTEYNIKREAQEFTNTFHECPVCLCSKIGSSCMQLLNCQHVFCNECLLSYLSIRISDGDVTSLCCPTEKCNSEIPPMQVKSLVQPSDFERYDRLLLQNSLDLMSDIIYCPLPHCRSPVVADGNDQMAICGGCNFSFCVLCKKAYHGIDKCMIEKGEIKRLLDEYNDGGDKVKRSFEEKFGKRAVRDILDEYESRRWLSNNSRPCPNCSTQIEKTEGCNKMVCFKCKAIFCWLCLNVIKSSNPYLHFASSLSSCYGKLFPFGEGAQEEEFDWQ